MEKIFETEIASTATRAAFDAAVERAVAWLQAGEVVALPTETVYGLAANALKEGAVKRIFAIKGRPPSNPLIVHVAGLEMAKRLVGDWPAVADRLARAFWPGPLTIVLKRASSIPDAVTAGGETVGLRWPSHPFMQAVVQGAGLPLAAPSANPSNRISPTQAAHVCQTLQGRIPLIVDGGGSQIGIESTVLDLTVSPPRILRPGVIHEELLEAVIGHVQAFGRDAGNENPASKGEKGSDADAAAPHAARVLKSPGQLPKHYAPHTPLRVGSWHDQDDLARQVESIGYAKQEVAVIAHSHIPFDTVFGHVSVMPCDAEAFARALYAELHRCDEKGLHLIVIEALPDGSEWQAIEDRICRAAGGK